MARRKRSAGTPGPTRRSLTPGRAWLPEKARPTPEAPCPAIDSSAEPASAQATAAQRAPSWPFWLAYGFVGCVLAGLIGATLWLNDGTFIYTLDDPYIHLSVSEQIRAGGYGVNPGQFSAPSSSIVFPFLLAPFARTPLHPFVPLLLNVAALFGTLEILRRFLLRLAFGGDRASAGIAAVFVALCALALNLAGLALSGMEHSAHILLTAALVYALIAVVEEGRLVGPLVAAAVLAPLLRYEALALSIAALGVLALRGWRRTAFAALAAIGAEVVGFSVFLLALGLPPLPSSVLVKSNVAAGGVDGSGLRFVVSMLTNAAEMSEHSIGLLLQLCAVGAALFAAREHLRGARSGRALLAWVLVALLAGHAAAGHFDWFDRYEIYAVVATVMLVAQLARDSLRGALEAPWGRPLVLCGGVALLMVGGVRYLRATALVPLAANNIYEQQYQMHRFITEFHPRPTCVNDLGWTSYRNDAEVVDLWGLGSERARVLRLRGAGPDQYAALARERGADLAIMYADGFGYTPPPGWVPVAGLALSRMRVTPAFEWVEFYATDPAHVDALRAELRAFAATLPPRIHLEIH